MDYSMLLVIERKSFDPQSVGRISINPRASRKVESSSHVFETEDMIYHIAVIDYLQSWNCNKKGERFFKTKLLMKNGAKLSAIEPI
jgi:hypothetical protein